MVVPMKRLPERTFFVHLKIEELSHWRVVYWEHYYYGPYARLQDAKAQAALHVPDDEDIADLRHANRFVGKTEIDIIESPQVYSVIESNTYIP